MIDDRVHITLYNSDGTIELEAYGPYGYELKERHENGTCNMWCDYCYTAACEMMDKMDNNMNKTL